MRASLTILAAFAATLALGAYAGLSQDASLDQVDVPPLPTVAPKPTVNATAETEVEADLDVPGPTAGLATYASWSFDFPLLETDDGLVVAFRQNASMQERLVVRVAWQSADGDVPVAEDDGAVLSLVPQRGQQRTYNPAVFENGTAVFHVPHADLVTASTWTLRARVAAHDVQAAGASASTWSLFSRSEGPASDADAERIHVLDGDRDGRADDIDNCPTTPNPDQANLDGDIQGDACDADRDGDGYPNSNETAAGSDPDHVKSTPNDFDGDGFSNARETEAGADPRNAKSTPFDQDADLHLSEHEVAAGSDPYDPKSTPMDRDGDGSWNEADNCPDHANPGMADGDADGIGNACDPNPEDGPAGDQDGDNVLNADDVCPLLADDQTDSDGDGRGDACDSDRDGDGSPNAVDAFPDDAAEHVDTDGDGVGDNADSDDDNDGLADTGEAALGTDPLLADTDGDTVDDFRESTTGTDPLDRFSPDWRAQDVRATVREDGTVEVRWSGGDARVHTYRVWRNDPLVVVADVPARGALTHVVVDADYPLEDQMYGVQAIMGDIELDLAAVVTTPVYQREALAIVLEAPPESGPAPEDVPDDPVVSKDSPGPALAVLVAAVGLAALVRRQ